MRALFLLAASAALASCGGGNDRPRPIPTPTPAPTPAACDKWTIGPNVSGDNFSRNMPLHPGTLPDGSCFLDFGPDAEPHYVTFLHGPLSRTQTLRMHYRVEAAPETVVFGKGCATTSPSAVTLYFQRAGDNWRTDGWRWWATFASKTVAGASEEEVVAPLLARWTSVTVMDADSSAGVFQAALSGAGEVGFTFANCEGYGHGVRATGPVRFVWTYDVLDTPSPVPSVGERG